MNVHEIGEKYKETYMNLRKNKLGPKEAHIQTMETLRNMYPEIRNVTFESSQGFASVIGNTKQLVERTLQEPLPNIVEDERDERTMMDTMRALSMTGFIPFGIYLKPLLGEHKAKQVIIYISHLRNEGWDAEKVEHGWIMTIKENKNEEVLQRLMELKAEISKIEESLVN